jgi:hypothetical protein
LDNLTPKRILFTKGVGYHRNKLQSFEPALRSAGIEKSLRLQYLSAWESQRLCRRNYPQTLPPCRYLFTAVPLN